MSAPTYLKPHSKDLGGGFVVNRLLPSAQQQAVGPFIFFDHFGPVTVEPGANHDVRPHPHIGLATLTYLFEGVILHRDNLGYVQRIEPGALNWMTAGSGIVHSERKPPEQAQQRYVNHGLQLWLALPEANEEDAASFVHTPASAIPELTVDGATVRVLVGEAFGARSPVATLSPTLYLDVQLPAGSTWTLPMLAEQQAIYPVQGSVALAGAALAPHTMAVIGALLHDLMDRHYHSAAEISDHEQMSRAVRSYRKLIELIEAGDSAAASAHWHRQLVYLQQRRAAIQMLDLFKD